jgi:hypothetical protein
MKRSGQVAPFPDQEASGQCKAQAVDKDMTALWPRFNVCPKD